MSKIRENLKILLDGGKLISDDYRQKIVTLDNLGRLVDTDGDNYHIDFHYLEKFKPYKEPIKVYVHVYESINGYTVCTSNTTYSWEEMQYDSLHYKACKLIKTIVLGSEDG